METWTRKAERYRERAEEMRVMGESMITPAAKVSFAQLAEEYDAMAVKALENAEGERPRRV